MRLRVRARGARGRQRVVTMASAPGHSRIAGAGRRRAEAFAKQVSWPCHLAAISPHSALVLRGEPEAQCSGVEEEKPSWQ